MPLVTPPVVTISSNSVTAKVLGSVTFVCSAIGHEDFSYEWELPNLVLATGRSLTINSVLPQQQGQYKCTATSSFSNLSSNAFATLHVKGMIICMYVIVIIMHFIAPSFDSQITLLHQISFSASANTITVFVPKADESDGPIR